MRPSIPGAPAASSCPLPINKSSYRCSLSTCCVRDASPGAVEGQRSRSHLGSVACCVNSGQGLLVGWAGEVPSGERKGVGGSGGGGILGGVALSPDPLPPLPGSCYPWEFSLILSPLSPCNHDPQSWTSGQASARSSRLGSDRHMQLNALPTEGLTSHQAAHWWSLVGRNAPR